MRVAIIEDEPVNAFELKKQILRYNRTIQIERIIDTIEESIKYLALDQPDLLFMDIELADGTSFEIFNQVEISCPIVFTTAYDQYALRAFEQNSISYLMKPITYSKVEQVFTKFKSLKRLFKQDIDLLRSEVAFKENFLIKVGKKLVPIPSKEIQYFYTTDNICYLITVKGEKFLSSYNLTELEDLLNPSSFFRISRQFIVSRLVVSHLEPYIKGQVKFYFKDDIEMPEIVSRQKTKLLKEWLS